MIVNAQTKKSVRIVIVTTDIQPIFKYKNKNDLIHIRSAREEPEFPLGARYDRKEENLSRGL